MKKMILRRVWCVCWGIFLCLALGPSVKAQVTVYDQGYQNLLISIEPNVDFSKGKETIEKIQELIRNTSTVLHKAIGIGIASATFLLPPSWSTEKWKDIHVSSAFSPQTQRRPDISVDATKGSPFGKHPLTLQYGGCGVPGYQITLPLDFLENTEGYPKDKLLAREWLKYRYGVFDENGFSNDFFYPDYYIFPGGSEIKFTECTNSKVTYNFKKLKDDDVCEVDNSNVYLPCTTSVDEKSAANVTSSLMYFHKDLPNMESICGKDGHPHNSLGLNKQNALCNGQSIWDVVKTSGDFKTTGPMSVNPDTEYIQFSYIKESKPRFVVLLENSDKLHEQLSAIRFSLRRFYYDLPRDSKFGLYTYSNNVKEVLPYTELPQKRRKDLGIIADFGTPATSICTSCGVSKAAQILLKDSEVQKGSILLITASPLDKVPVLSSKLKRSGICLHVLRFNDGDSHADQTYDALAKSFHCFSQESLHSSLDVVESFNNLFRFLKNPVPKFSDGFVSKTVASGNMSSENPVIIPEDKSALLYTIWLGRALGKGSVVCKAGNTVLKLEADTKATDIASFTFVPKNENVQCRLDSVKQSPLLTQVQMKTKQDFEFDAWIHDLSTEKEQLPIMIYAKIYYGKYPIRYATVTAVVKSLNHPKENVTLLDIGTGDPDITRHDGIYGGYFTNFLEAANYQITVKFKANEGQAVMGKRDPLRPRPCCGFEIDSIGYDVPAFKMEKIILYQAKNKTPKDGYPPSKIINLKVLVRHLHDDTVTLLWSTPGGGKAVGYSIKVFKSREDAVTKFDTNGRELDSSSMQPKLPTDTGKLTVLDIPLQTFEEGVTHYVAMRSWNEFNKQSEISNVVEFVNQKPIKRTTQVKPETTTEKVSSKPETTTEKVSSKPDPPTNSGKTVGIVLGVVFGFSALCALAYLGYYYFVKKPRRS